MIFFTEWIKIQTHWCTCLKIICGNFSKKQFQESRRASYVIEILWELDHINALIYLRSLMLRCCRPPRDFDVIILCSHSTLSFYLMQELFSIYFVYLQPVKSEIFRYNLEKKVNKHVCKINIFPSTPENRPTLCLHNNISACDLISFSLLLFIYVFKLQFIVL